MSDYGIDDMERKGKAMINVNININMKTSYLFIPTKTIHLRESPPHFCTNENEASHVRG